MKQKGSGKGERRMVAGERESGRSVKVGIDIGGRGIVKAR